MFGVGELGEAFVRFATNLNPNSESLSWPRFDSSSRDVLTFIDPVPRVDISQDDYRQEAMKYLTQVTLAHPIWTWSRHSFTIFLTVGLFPLYCCVATLIFLLWFLLITNWTGCLENAYVWKYSLTTHEFNNRSHRNSISAYTVASNVYSATRWRLKI